MLTGSRLGVYEVAGPLGAGGMGEVYRARDTRLHRDVALRLLPASVAADPERLAGFTREAQLLAALNHPNIAAIHGLEESGGRPWSPAGDKLYFRELSGNIMVVDVTAKPEVSLSAPRVVPKPSTLIARAGFDLARDGKRLLLPRQVSDDTGRGPALTVVQNWFAEFRKEPNQN